MKRREAIIAGLMVWLIVIIFFALIARAIDLEIFFVLFLVGILVLVELVNPVYVTPQYLTYMKYVIAAGVIVFGTIVAGKILEILNR